MEEYDVAEAALWTAWIPEKLDRYFTQARQEVMHILHVIRPYPPKMKSIMGALLIKYVFSCLIDADRTNTQQFEDNHNEPWTHSRQDFFKQSYDRLITALRDLERSDDAKRPINQLRRNMSRQCDDFAIHRPPGIYTLSIPTGGGKTLASFRYALQHALQYKKERIIYVVPYTTIIEQNAAEIRKMLQDDDNILEHHSNVIDDGDLDDDDYDLFKKRLRLARDNWDRPIIFTTMVQFLNTLYAKGTRNTRRLHRLANAVLIFDEVQVVPVQCVSLFNAALNFLHIVGGSTEILCTATQPALDFVKNDLKLSQDGEIIDHLEAVHQQFKRVRVQDCSASPLNTAELSRFIHEHMTEAPQILVILNTKSAVRRLVQHLGQESWVAEHGVTVFHLSTSMCAAHRQEVIATMKPLLDTPTPIICVSTQLIEAGVNISFDCVIRSLAGLDSIAQAAGRCNRHGRDSQRPVYVIQSADEHLDHLPEISLGAKTTRRVFQEFAQDPLRFDADMLSPRMISTYFRYYFQHIREQQLDYPIPKSHHTLFELLTTNQSLYDGYYHKHQHYPEILSRPAFATAERHFQAITSPTLAVLVPYNAAAEEILLQLNGESAPDNLSDLLRRAQPFVVNLFDHEVRALDNRRAIHRLLHGHVLALGNPAYSPQFGVDIASDRPWDPEFA
jgi:CRISPR-associated endonuclease/helicase Cas3